MRVPLMTVCGSSYCSECIDPEKTHEGNMFHFTCFNVDDPDDPSVGLVDGQLSIPGNLLRREVFDPVIEEVCKAPVNLNVTFAYVQVGYLQVLQLMEDQVRRVDRRIDAMLLVGGFAGSNYLKQRVEVWLPTLPNCHLY
jgi:hypothetical protein